MLTTLLPFLDGWSAINTVTTITINKGDYETIAFEHKGAILFSKFKVTSADTRISTEGLLIDIDETPTTLADAGQTRDTCPIYLAVQTSPYVMVMNAVGYTKNAKLTLSLPMYSTDTSTTITYELHGIEVYDEEAFLSTLKEITPPTTAPTITDILTQIKPQPTEDEILKVLKDLKNAQLQTLEYLKKLTTFRW